MRDKFMRFMQGRYGTDALSKFLVIAGVILAVVSSATHVRVLYMIAWVMIIWSYFRMFSKDYAKRSAENRWYLNKTYKIRSKFAGLKNRMARVRTIIFINARPASRRFAFREAKERLRSAARNAVPRLSSEAEKMSWRNVSDREKRESRNSDQEINEKEPVS